MVDDQRLPKFHPDEISELFNFEPIIVLLTVITRLPLLSQGSHISFPVVARVHLSMLWSAGQRDSTFGGISATHNHHKALS